ncbi:hormogonium polysaccharide biosynthesis protein HpsA [Microcoleus sp. BR0-C5]|uniref:hormogonium polysaccharide biosynthesis protein HpsA n=1 Tax=Microcoleus sp. BR0-C5 TaxID=2818713 RepID=UPI002FD30C6E
MFKSKLSKVIVSLLRRIAGVTRSGAKRLMRAMLQALMAMGRRAKLPMAGFVLPTVTMVLLVVILLTVAITLRSFDRANTARNVRVNQQVLAAATPALDRAKAKIEYVLGEGRPVTGTPSDQQLYLAMSSYPAASTSTNPDLYSFGDEVRLKLKANLDSAPAISPDLKVTEPGFNLETNESINTAWRYPVDTNNDGEFDTFTLYGIFFRSPPRIRGGANAGDFTRERKPLEARTPPMSLGVLKEGCEAAAGNSASLVGESGWYRIDGKLKKSFFVYTVNVPFKKEDRLNLTPKEIALGRYKEFTGTTSISALEYQQDQSLIPLSNNAVVYEDDLDISPGPEFNLNGRVFTNSNLLVTNLNGKDRTRLYQVSSKKSCFYEQENSKIVVGGNVVNGWAGNTSTSSQINPIDVHLFKKTSDSEPNVSPPAIATATQSVKEKSLQVIYNSDAYSKRLNALVNAQMLAAPTTDPVSVQRAQLSPTNLQRKDALESYFKDRLRKVTFAEAPLGSDGGVVSGGSYLQGSGDSLRPIDAWSLPTAGTATVGAAAGPTGLTLEPNLPPANNPANVQPTDSEPELGNRVAIGNNLPALRWDGSKFLGSNDTQEVDGATTWKDDTTVKRTRTTQVTKLADVGATDRGNGLGEKYDPANPFKDGFWEASAAQIPKTAVDGTGGLRVITSAGVYDRTNSFLPPPKWIDAAGRLVTAPATYDDPATAATENYPVVWPDSMPMSPLGPGSKVYDNVAGDWEDWPTGAAADGTGLDATVASTTLLPGIVEQATTARKYAKGDLRMRATAVYHYEHSGYDPLAGTQPTQEPYACVSSYYDPSNASTAKNITTGSLTNNASFDVSGQAGLGSRPAFIGSNNGITYKFPATARPGVSTIGANGLLSGGNAVLDNQANLVFPDGRFANGPLRSALQVPEASRTLAQKAAIDSTNCALKILDGTIGTPDLSLIPHGAIQEVAFINGREVKAVDRDDPSTIVNEAFTLSSPVGTSAAAKLTGNYNQSLEEREPLEIRATQLNINVLRGNRPKGSTTEWLLPNSGIIYATRDDALPDRSNREDPDSSKRKSPTDSLLDPTRKPNGIVLINGQKLFRGADTPTRPTSINDIVREKGLILVSNVPVYIKGVFNLHGTIPTPPAGGTPTLVKVEEFDVPLTQPNWGNFYARAKLNDNFACRAGDPRLPKCTDGDFWRPATVLADAVHLLSQNYRFGFRNEGDFDLRNNAGAAAVLPRRQQGFFNNNFVTNGLSSGAFSDNLTLRGTTGASGVTVTDATYAAAAPLPRLWSSYFNNFVTPVQRRGPFPEYVMEVCPKLPVSECRDADWFVDLTPGAERTAKTLIDAGTTTYTSPDPANPTTSPFQAGSTVDPPIPALQRFPRRVAFERGTANDLVTPLTPKPLGISAGTGTITPGVVGRVRGNNALWFAAVNSAGNVVYNATNLPYRVNTNTTAAGTTDGSKVPLPTLAAASTVTLPAVTVPPARYTYNGSQPLLVPVPQLMGVTEVTGSGPSYPPRGTKTVQETGWIPQAVETTFNLIVGAGDTPSRALDTASGDFNGGLQNLPRFLEMWRTGPRTSITEVSNNVQGSFIQQNRSAFSTAPYQPILPDGYPTNAVDQLATLFSLSATPTTAPTPFTDSQALITYNTTNGPARIPYFTPPTRNWGYDVGLLSQPPDLFTQKFTTPPKTEPTEYFREVPRNDDWVKTLMCGVTDQTSKPATETLTTADRNQCPT